MTRIINNMQLGIEDIADIYGLKVNSYNVANAAYQYLNGQKSNPDIKKLNQNEKSVLITYINLYSTYVQNPDNI